MKLKPKRIILDKDPFMGSNRQKWTGILLLYSLLISFLQIKYKIMPEPYMQFALTIGSLFILGGSVDSFLKINASVKAPSPPPEEIMEEPEPRKKKNDHEGTD